MAKKKKTITKKRPVTRFEITSQVTTVIMFTQTGVQYPLNGTRITWYIRRGDEVFCFTRRQATAFIGWLNTLPFLQHNTQNNCGIGNLISMTFVDSNMRAPIVPEVLKIHPNILPPFAQEWIDLGFDVEGQVSIQ
jgi:hypothetical protein